jgi:hypothetical protein
MQRRTKCLVITKVGLALVAVTIVGVACYAQPHSEALEASIPSVAAADSMPTVSFWHVWTDEKGVSHQTRRELSDFKLESVSMGAAPSWIDKMSTPAASVVVDVQPVGWVGEWHENPKPQWIIPLSGRWFVETMDGKRVEMGPGDISFGGDQNTKPDSQGHNGHRSGTVGDQPSVNLFVQLDKDPFVEESGPATESTTKPELRPSDTGVKPE